jgi:hypothetical protein
MDDDWKNETAYGAAVIDEDADQGRFDSSGSKDDPWLFMLDSVIRMYPLGLLAGIILRWMGDRKGAFTRVLWWNALPLIRILPIASFYVYEFVI